MDQGFYFYLVFKKQEGDLVLGCFMTLISSMSICFLAGLHGLSTLVWGVVLFLCLLGHLFVQVKEWNNIGVLRFCYGYCIGYVGVVNHYFDCILLITCGNHGSVKKCISLGLHGFTWKFWKCLGLTVQLYISLWQRIWWGDILLETLWDYKWEEMEKEEWVRSFIVGLIGICGLFRLYLETNGTVICYVLLEFNYWNIIIELWSFCEEQWKRTTVVVKDSDFWWSRTQKFWCDLDCVIWFIRQGMAFMRYQDIFASVSPGSMELHQIHNI